MSGSVSLRPVADADRELIRRIFASTRAEELKLVPWTDEQKEAFVDQQFHAQSTHYAKHYPRAAHDVILSDGEAVGRLYVDRGESDILIVDIALLPQGRGRGIGTHLLGQLADEADASARTLTIHVEVNNPARRLYERFGFVLLRQEGPYFEMRRAPKGSGSSEGLQSE